MELRSDPSAHPLSHPHCMQPFKSGDNSRSASPIPPPPPPPSSASRKYRDSPATPRSSSGGGGQRQSQQQQQQPATLNVQQQELIQQLQYIQRQYLMQQSIGLQGTCVCVGFAVVVRIVRVTLQTSRVAGVSSINGSGFCMDYGGEPHRLCAKFPSVL